MAYLLAHWRGQLSLNKSLWLNTLGLGIAISVLELTLLGNLAVAPGRLIRLTLISLFFTRLVVFPWQLVGLFRAIENDYLAERNIFKTRGLQGIALLLMLITLVYSLEVIQGAIFYRSQVEFYAQPKAGRSYTLEVTANRKLKVQGDFEVGISTAAGAILSENPDIRAVVLQSRGGQIYEGRGLARLFIELGLDTYVFEECSSACATAFVGGQRRYLGPHGKLGFHRYKLDTSQMQRAVAFYDLGAEQQRDLALFEARGIDPGFLRSMYAQPASRIWFPDQQTLLGANMVHAIVADEDSVK